MDESYIRSQITIIRRAAENARYAQENQFEMIDALQHIVDEARRTESAANQEL